MINTDLFFIGNAFWIGLANHLWQSTLFAGAAWLITLLLKRNRARIRYWIWFSVSIKFLIPFSILIGLGSLIAPEWMKAPVEIPPQWSIIHTINQPFDTPDLRGAAPTIDIKKTSLESDIIDASSLSDKIPVVIFFLWLCGSFALLLSWHKRGMRVFRMARKAQPLIDNHSIEAFHRMKQKHRIPNFVQLASANDLMEPGVYGILRPVLLLPAGIMKHINDSELEAIFLHEFEHIRCRDNLIAFIHMIVQALFWFHPVVWLTGSRLYFERELACDEAVLQAAKNPQAYAEGILKVCEYCLKSPLACVSGVIGSNLTKRMEGIMKNQIGHKLGFMKRLLLSFAGLLVLGIPLALGIINAPASQARSFDNDKSDILKTYSKAERSIEPSGIVREEQDQSSLPLNANTMIQTAVNHGEKAVSFKAVPKTASKDNESSIVLAKMETPVKVASSDSGSNDVELNTEGADKYISMGISSLKKGQLEDAVSEFSSAVNLDPGKALTYVARGSAYFELGQFDKALSDYNRAIGIDPDLAAAYQNRGSVYYRQGQLDKAISDYNRAIKINPDFAVAYVDRGTIYQSRGQFDKAISDYSRALKLNPEDAVLYNYQGSAYFEQKQYQKAFTDFNRAIELDPGYVSAYINRGNYYHEIHDVASASADYQKALQLDPKGPYSKKLKAYIDYAANQEVECRRQRKSLMNLTGSKVCKTKAEWAAERKIRNLWDYANWPSTWTTPAMSGGEAEAVAGARDNWAREH